MIKPRVGPDLLFRRKGVKLERHGAPARLVCDARKVYTDKKQLTGCSIFRSQPLYIVVDSEQIQLSIHAAAVERFPQSLREENSMRRVGHREKYRPGYFCPILRVRLYWELLSLRDAPCFAQSQEFTIIRMTVLRKSPLPLTSVSLGGALTEVAGSAQSLEHRRIVTMF
jgi:hypothetical protein